MLLTISVPLTEPTVVGENVIGKVIDWPAASEDGGTAGTENGGLGPALIKEMAAVEVPVLETVTDTFSDWLTGINGNTTDPDPTGMPLS